MSLEFIYIISTPEKSKNNEYKISKHIGSQRKLLKVYQAVLSMPMIFYTCLINEKINYKTILENLKKYEINSEDREFTNWIKLDLDSIIKIINKVEPSAIIKLPDHVKIGKLNPSEIRFSKIHETKSDRFFSTDSYVTYNQKDFIYEFPILINEFWKHTVSKRGCNIYSMKSFITERDAKGLMPDLDNIKKCFDHYFLEHFERFQGMKLNEFKYIKNISDKTDLEAIECSFPLFYRLKDEILSFTFNLSIDDDGNILTKFVDENDKYIDPKVLLSQNIFSFRPYVQFAKICGGKIKFYLYKVIKVIVYTRTIE